ncbi:protein obstructor-E-like isoform X1 [Zootermopsis nevadensis]|uniref:Putative chitinase 3 n=1 Tax=Zootermopsis nevadensis TaxID=136037 RepID=A0A067RM00_ZOONE|nr:protein obstructor-E-like isoform X1 [Zootermopsis nevadensis]KDR20622.1 putative chitinase 3 [Zootermopsis nevadensis]
MMKIWTGIIFFSNLAAVFGDESDVSFTPAKPWSQHADWPFCELGGTYSVPHKKFCDRFFICQNGQAYLGQCEDGLAFVPFNGCKLLHFVDCSVRTKLQSPKGKGKCPRLNGLHKAPKGCGNFYKCENGTVVPDKCAGGYEFDGHTKLCRLATPQEREKCSHSSTSSGFKCPANNVFPFGDHSRHPYPGSCSLFIMCLRDGSIKVGSCSAGSAYSPATHNCELKATVPGCSQIS